jgi:hypothetical protein
VPNGTKRKGIGNNVKIFDNGKRRNGTDDRAIDTWIRRFHKTDVIHEEYFIRVLHDAMPDIYDLDE